MADLPCWIVEGGEPAASLALEERLLLEAASGPRFFLYRFSRPAVVLGYAQPAEDVDLDVCRRLGLPVLRRVTGGTGVLHEASLSLSLALPAFHPLAREIHGLYGAFVSTVEAVLLEMGVPVRRWSPGDGSPRPRSPLCFEDHRGETLLLNGRKVLGCAQTRRREAVLVHGVLPLSLDPEKAAAVFRLDPGRVLAAMAPLRLPPAVPPQGLVDGLIRAFGALLGSAPSRTAPPRLSASLLQAHLEDRRRVILKG